MREFFKDWISSDHFIPTLLVAFGLTGSWATGVTLQLASAQAETKELRNEVKETKQEIKDNQKELQALLREILQRLAKSEAARH